MTYLERLAARMAHTGTALCVGIDPDPDALPAGFAPDVHGVEAFARLVLEAAAPRAAAVKANLAFYEAWGSEGLAALERLRRAAPPDVPFIADAKRGDIASTSLRHAMALFDVLGADAVTASPYLGVDAITPLLERTDRFVYVLCRTSNPGAGELQDVLVLETSGGQPEPLYLRVARLARGWTVGRGTVGLVVGATATRELAAIRSAAPELPFLVPGVGRQGGDASDALIQGAATAGPAGSAPGGAVLVNVSRAIAQDAAAAADPGPAIAASVEVWAERLRV